MPPHRRPDYLPDQRLAILQLKRLRGWNIAKTARRFVVHPNTIRSWIKAIEGRGNVGLFQDAIRWNRIDDLVRWTAGQLRRLCSQPEFGARTIARHLVRAGIAISRSSVQRILREPQPKKPPPRRRPPIASPAGIEAHHLLRPDHSNHVWHLDLTCLRVLWRRFTVAAILDGFSRKLLCLHVFAGTPRQRDLTRLVLVTTRRQGSPRFIITDRGTQFRSRFHAAITKLNIHHVKGRVRAPYLSGKVERSFRTLRLWWRSIHCGLNRKHVQRQLNNYAQWYNEHRPHGALNGLTAKEAWEGFELPQPIPVRQRDVVKPRIELRRIHCRGDPHLPVIRVAVRRAA